MGVLFNKVDRSDLRVGDHVYSWRSGYTYAHHGIFVGDNDVIHFTRGLDQELGAGASLITSLASSSMPKQSLSCPRFPDSCVFQNGNNGVIRSCLDCFLEGGHVYRFEYGVSKAVLFAQARGGTCTLAQSDPPKTVVHRAEYLLQNGFGNYDIISKNCEDFAIYCKTGFIVKSNDSGSGQIAAMRAARFSFTSYRYTVMLADTVLLAAGPVGVAFMVVGVYSLKRYQADIGVRVDKAQVPVEYLAEYLESLIRNKPSESSKSQAKAEAEAPLTAQKTLN